MGDIEKEMDEAARKLMKVKLPGDITLTLNLSPKQAEALLRLSCRLGPERLHGIVEGREEATQMLAALGKLAFAISKAQ